MIDSLAMPGGISYEDYLSKCLAPMQTQNISKSTFETEEESFEDATEEPSEVVHEKKKPFNCKTCNVHFEDETELDNHIKSAHASLKLFQCNICGVGFEIESDLKNHLKSDHEGKKPFNVILVIEIFQ